MTSNIVKYQDELIQLHSEIKDLAQKTIFKAILAGELLTEIKSSLPHGEFLSWIKENMPFSTRTAQVYMKAFERKAEIKNGTIESLSQLTPKNAESAHLTTVEHLTKLINGEPCPEWTVDSEIKYSSELRELMYITEQKSIEIKVAIRAMVEFSELVYMREKMDKKVWEAKTGKKSSYEIQKPMPKELINYISTT